MKKLYTLLTVAIIATSVFGQAPEKMSYQAVIRDAGNALVTNQVIGMQISILQDSVSGTIVYAETQISTSNNNGLISIEFGNGTVVSGAFNTIDWSNGPYFIKTETDPTGGNAYTIIGISQLLSVPYALHANTADSITGAINYTETDPIFSNSLANGITANDTVNWNNDLVIDGDTTFWKTNGDSIYTNHSVGIGTSNPAGALDVHGLIRSSGPAFTKTVDLSLEQDQPSLVFNNSITDYRADFRMLNSTGDLRFSTGLLSNGPLGQTVHMTILQNGNVGISTSNPTAKLNVNSGPNGGASVRFRNGFGTSKVLHIIEEGGSSNHYGLFIGSLDYSSATLVTKSQNVGIGIDSPIRALHINDVMRLEPRISAPSSASAGDIYFSSTTNKLMVYDGTTWQACW